MFACIGDVYLLTRPGRARTVLDILSRNLQELCGISVNQGNLHNWNRSGGAAPPDLAALDTPDHIRVLVLFAFVCFVFPLFLLRHPFSSAVAWPPCRRGAHAAVAGARRARRQAQGTAG